MNTVIFSIYDNGCHSSALFLNEGFCSPIENTYFENLRYADDVKDYEDDKLFDYFADLFDKPIGEVIVVEDGTVNKVRYKGEYFAKLHRYFGCDTVNHSEEVFLKPYVSKEEL